MNTSEIISLWLSGKYKELFVKNMVGIKNVHIYSSLIFNYLCLVLISFCIGAIFSFFIINSLQNIIEINFSFVACLLSFGISFITGLVFGTIIYSIKIKRGILELKKWDN